MNWQKISIERLREYESRKRALEIIPEQLNTLELKYTAIRSATTDSIAVSDGSGNKREDALINNIVMRQELEGNLNIAKKEVAITEKGLQGLSPTQQKILQMFYVDRTHGHIETLCEELHFEKSRVYVLKDEALKKFTMSCYGVVEI